MARIIRPMLLLGLLLVLARCSDNSGSELSIPQILIQREQAKVPVPASIATIPALPTRTTVPTRTLSPSYPTWTLSPTCTATPSPAPTWTPTVAPTRTPSTTTLDIPRLDLNPDEPIPYLETFRLLTYYGSPTGWGLGILGESARDLMTRNLRARALQLQALSPDRFVLPTYHMVTTVADKHPGPDENYSHQVNAELLQGWITAAKEYKLAVIIDIQPARADLQEEFDRIKHFLRDPHVHLALDPEFIVNEQQIPSSHLGQIQADQINAIQEQLNEIALEIGINRVLIIHQFEDSMVVDKAQLTDFLHVELVIDADGVGDQWNKLLDYRQYVKEPGFEYGGIKVFTRHDSGLLLTPKDLMELEPPPAVVIYQ